MTKDDKEFYNTTITVLRQHYNFRKLDFSFPSKDSLQSALMEIGRENICEFLLIYRNALKLEFANTTYNEIIEKIIGNCYLFLDSILQYASENDTYNYGVDKQGNIIKI